MASVTTLLSLVFLIALPLTPSQARIHGVYYGGSRQRAHHATSYGCDCDASETIGGSHRKENLNSQGYGGHTATLFNNHLSCGPCSGIKCANSHHWCPSIFVTATNFFPQNDVVHNENGAHRLQSHFHLAMPMFLNNDENCPAFKYFNLVLIADVAGAGDDMVRVSTKGTKTGWMPLSSNWGENRQSNAILVGQSLSFRVTRGDGRTSTFANIVPSIWQLGQTTIPKHVPYRKLFTTIHSIPAHIIAAGMNHTRPIHALNPFKLLWRSGPGFGIQRLPSEVQASEAPSPNPGP